MFLHEIYRHLYSRSPLDCLGQARFIHDQYGNRLRNDKSISFLIAELSKVTEELTCLMADMDMGRICSGCALREGGGCCSIYMAGECDTLQILMNLLAGNEVNLMRENGTDCCFLGPDGCVFLFKPMFCLNYNCSHISKAAGGEKMRRLEKKSGVQLSAQYKLEQQLLNVLRSQNEMVMDFLTFCKGNNCG